MKLSSWNGPIQIKGSGREGLSPEVFITADSAQHQQVISNCCNYPSVTPHVDTKVRVS